MAQLYSTQQFTQACVDIENTILSILTSITYKIISLHE
jgi:hypothetical protein